MESGMKTETHSDPLSEESVECPWCSEFISEELDEVEPDCRGTEIICPNCAKAVSVTLEIVPQYRAVPIQKDGKLSLAEAIKTRSCRICGERMGTIRAPKDFGSRFDEKWTLNFGKEFAHTGCLER